MMFGSEMDPGSQFQPAAMPQPDLPQFKKPGMFGAGKVQIDLGRALAGYLAGIGNPAGVQALRSMDERRQQQAEEQAYEQRRQQSLQDQMSLYDYKAAHPEPANNDTANDYAFWQQHLTPEQFQEYVSNKVNPPQLMNVPGVGIVSIPRQQSAPQVPTAPVGKLTPLGGPTPGGSGGFPY